MLELPVSNGPPKPLLLLAYYYAPMITSGVQRALRMVRYLPENGYMPHVVCSSEEGVLLDAGVSSVPAPSTESEAGSASRWAARLQRACLPYNEQLPWVPHALAAAEQVMSRSRVAAVISTSPPTATHLAALSLKWRHRNLKWLADFRDPLLGNPGRPRKWARPYDAAIERAIFASCDAAMAVTDVVAGEWKKRYPQWAHKCHLVWNGFDPEERFEPLPVPPGPKTLLHAGVVYPQRHPYWLVSAVDRLISAGKLNPSEFRLRLIGEVLDREKFCAHPAASSLITRGCLECDGKTVPRSVAMRAVASSDYLLILDIANLSEIGYTVPAKLYDNIRIGRPILLFTPSGESPTARILRQSGVRHAIVQPDDSADTVDRKVFEFLQLPSEPLTPSEWFHDNFDGRRQAHLIGSILDGLLQDKSLR